MEWYENYPPSCHELTARGWADRLHIIIFKLHPVGCKLVQHRRADVWAMVADVCITLIVHHDEDKVRMRPGPFSLFHAWIFMHVLIFNRAAKNIRHSNQQEKHRVDSSFRHQHCSVSIFSSLILSVFSVLLSLQQINLVQRRSVCPQVQSKSFIRPLLKEFSSVRGVFPHDSIKWVQSRGGWREAAVSRVAKRLAKVCVWVSVCVRESVCISLLHSFLVQVPWEMTKVHVNICTEQKGWIDK